MIFNLFLGYTIEAQSCLVVGSFSLFKLHGELTDRFTMQSQMKHGVSAVWWVPLPWSDSGV